MDLVADTNVWYDLGAGTLSPTTVKNGNRLLATPLNHLELCSSVTARSLPDRSAAASAFLAHADSVLPDSETHLAHLWGVNRTPPPLTITADLQLLANATSVPLFSTIVPATQGSSTGIPVDLSIWRSTHWNDFCDGIIQAIDTEVPGYRNARAKGAFKYLPGKLQPALKARLTSGQFRDEFIDSTYRRVLVSEGKQPSSPAKALLTRTTPQLAPYAAVYAQYVIGCACTFAPQPNDFGDLESFIYLQPGTFLLTSEKRWHTIAKAAGCPHLVINPHAI